MKRKFNPLLINILDLIYRSSDASQKLLAVLIDPDKAQAESMDLLIGQDSFRGVDLLLVGGSLVEEGHMKKCLKYLRSQTDKPVVIFPGSPNQIDDQADAILLLSLISGRNPDLLIGKHVESAFRLQHSGLEIIPTSYILIDGGRSTAVAYISNTQPIPQDKMDIAVSTSLAGKMLGHKLTYLDCGSGARYPVSPALTERIKAETQLPLVVGGGIRSAAQAERLYRSGVDLIVVGNKLEEDPGSLNALVALKESLNSSLAQRP